MEGVQAVQMAAMIAGSFKLCRCSLRTLEYILGHLGYCWMDHTDAEQYADELYWRNDEDENFVLTALGQAQAIILRKFYVEHCVEIERIKATLKTHLEQLSDWTF